MTAARLAALCGELLGPVEGPVLVEAEPAGWSGMTFGSGPPSAGDRLAGAVVVWLSRTADASTRRALLAAVRDRLSVGTPLVVVDYNQPRLLWMRCVAAVGMIARGTAPSRARYPVAREVAALGFTVVRLALCDHERVQLVRAVRTAAADSKHGVPGG